MFLKIYIVIKDECNRYYDLEINLMTLRLTLKKLYLED